MNSVLLILVIAFALSTTILAVLLKREKTKIKELSNTLNDKAPAPQPEPELVSDSPSAILIGERLEQMIEERFYTQQDINLIEFSRRIHVNREYVSQFLKANNDETFSSFVSRLRVDYARTLLKDPETRVSEVGEKVGFSNASTFYRNFTAQVGCSPKEYQLQQQQR